MAKTKRAFIAGITAAIVIVAGVTAYIQGKHYVTRKEVKSYLTGEGHAASDISTMDSFIANLSGDKNYGKSNPGFCSYNILKGLNIALSNCIQTWSAARKYLRIRIICRRTVCA